MIIPKYDTVTGKFSEIEFTEEEYILFLKQQIKFPGEYNYDSRIDHFRSQAIKFEKNGYYCEFVEDTLSFREYWDTQKNLSFSGLIVDDWYITGDHYFYLNFLHISDKVKKIDTFPTFWDTDSWVFLSIELARKTHKNFVCTKKRQIGFTLKILAILLKEIWFNQSQINKILAYDEKYVKDAWNFLEMYRDHLNSHTAWYRPFSPDKVLDWKQQIEVKQGGKKIYKGRKSTLKGFSYKDNPAKPVAGKNDTLFFEESGISDTLGKAYGYALNALKFGNIITGICIIGGSVGELKQADELKRFMLNPEENGFLSFPNIWSNKEHERVGMFIPEYYSYGDCIDKYGNSLIEEAKIKILEYRDEIKLTAPQDYQLKVSQSPMSIEECFAVREENIFPTEIIAPHLDYLEREFRPAVVDLIEDVKGKLHHVVTSDFIPVSDWPIKKATDKRGAICMVEPPISDNLPLGLYYAGVDPITSKQGATSDSLFSIYIYKATHEINNEFVMDQCVAWYTGRYDNYEYTFEIARKLIKYYNVRAAIENDQSAFIEWLIHKKEQIHIMKRSDMPILSEIVPNSKIGEEYGFRTGSGRSRIKDFLHETLATYCSEIISTTFDENGKPHNVYGVTRIKDKMLLKEMMGWSERVNTDRIIAFAAALMAARTNTYRQNVVKHIPSGNTVQNLKTFNTLQINKDFFKRHNKNMVKSFKSFR